jgi:hypothetical protein
MKTKQLLFSLIFVASAFVASAQDLYFTTTGSCASYITWNNYDSHQADSVYEIKKAHAPIVVDGVADAEWANAVPGVLKKIANEKKAGEVLDLSMYPQDETDLYASFKALWTDNGVYMLIDVKDDYVRYQNYQYQWENDGIEFYFAKAIGDGKIQLIIPAMVGTPHPSKPAAKDFESGSAVGSDPDYKVFGYDDANWDASLFNWAIKKTATGYTMEVYLDKDIVTNGNSATNYGKDKMFVGDINVDESDLTQNTNDPALYVRDGTLALLGNSNQEYASSNNYGYYKMTDNVEPLEFTTTGSCASYMTINNRYSRQADSITEIELTSSPIAVDGVLDGAWSEANSYVIKKGAHETAPGEVLDLSRFPTDETDLYATYRTLWNQNGVYMFFEVKDDYVRYQNFATQWENDGIEFYFAKAIGDGKIQIIIPAMVGTPDPAKPAALTLETGSAVGSDPDYKVFGYDDANWDASLFNWAIKKTDVGYNMEVYMDKDIVTNGNSATNYGLDKTFVGDFNIDESDLTISPWPGYCDNMFIRDCSLAAMSNSNQEYANSNYYGYFKMVDKLPNTSISQKKADNNDVIYDSRNKQVLVRSSDVSSVAIYNSVGQIVKNNKNNNSFSVSNFDRGMYFIKAIDAKGNILSVKKIVIY